MALCASVAVPAAQAETPAKQLFGAARIAAAGPPQPFGSYAKGCIQGAARLADNGPQWQAMRLSRNRHWGHPTLVEFIGDLAAQMPPQGWRGLLVGDMSQPRGGPMLTGHASHQIGLDADIWLMEMPERRLSPNERESLSAVSMLREGTRAIDPNRFGPGQKALIRTAANDPRVARIFVHPAIKRELCRTAEGDRSWLRHVRAWYGHHYHMHVRLNCPSGAVGCVDQAPPPAGEGCGAELDWWFTAEPWTPKPGKPVAKKPLTLASLPNACRALVQ